MKNYKPSELREKSADELGEMLAQEMAALYKARRDLVFRQNTDTTGIQVRRHNIARLHTLIAEKSGGKA